VSGSNEVSEFDSYFFFISDIFKDEKYMRRLIKESDKAGINLIGIYL